MEKERELKLKGKMMVVVDWANVWGWRGSLGGEVDFGRLFGYLRDYKQVRAINFYFGTDKNQKSEDFLKMVRDIGYTVRTKPVKYVAGRRKCDFDLEIGMDVLLNLSKFDGFVFLSGDGDFAPLYEYLAFKRKQVIVMFASGHLGREIYNIGRKLYLFDIRRLSSLLLEKNIPRHEAGGVIRKSLTKVEKKVK